MNEQEAQERIAALERELAEAKALAKLWKQSAKRNSKGFNGILDWYEQTSNAIRSYGSGDIVADSIHELWRFVDMLSEGLAYDADNGVILSSDGGFNSVVLWCDKEAHFIGHMLGRLKAYKKHKPPTPE